MEITIDEILENEVRALSWKQPYADLMLRGKQETRRRPTNYRGLVLICASKIPFNQAEVFELSGVDQEARINDVYDDLHADPEPYNVTGNAIGIGRLVNCRPMTESDQDATFVAFNPDLLVYEFEDVREIIPFGWKGSQGWTTLNHDQKRLIILKPGNDGIKSRQ